MIYENLKRNINNITEVKNNVSVNFVKGAFVEIKGPYKAEYIVDFIDNRSGKRIFSTNIGNNCWTKCTHEYFIEWKIQIYQNGKLWYEHLYDATDKRVYIPLDSKALGDTMAWFPYVDEFRKKHNCKVVTSTFMNDLFVDEYSELEFINPGEAAENLYAMYSIGLFYNDNNEPNLQKNPNDFRKQPLQKMSSDILGLEYVEVRPKIKHNPIEINSELKQICIGVFGTAQPKFWNNKDGWQYVVDWLNSKGYTVKLISKEGDDYMGNKLPTGIVKHPNGPLSDVIDELRKSKAFIGIGSGLSWLSWAVNTPTVLVSGFSYDWAEMQDCVRIGAPEGKCSGCFNRYRLDAGDWNWCPDHKGTDRQFECTKSITPQSVIKELEKFL
jgi:autotransporter strand-loop-strand O-heptosyltransferase